MNVGQIGMLLRVCVLCGYSEVLTDLQVLLPQLLLCMWVMMLAFLAGHQMNLVTLYCQYLADTYVTSFYMFKPFTLHYMLNPIKRALSWHAARRHCDKAQVQNRPGGSHQA